jgi:hypothetical protein
MDFKIPEVFVFRLNSAISKNLKSQIATSSLGIHFKINLPFRQTEKLEITNSDIKLVAEIVHSFHTKNNHTGVRFENWRCQFGTSNSVIQYMEKPVISINPEVVANCDNLN